MSDRAGGVRERKGLGGAGGGGSSGQKLLAKLSQPAQCEEDKRALCASY